MTMVSGRSVPVTVSTPPRRLAVTPAAGSERFSSGSTWSSRRCGPNGFAIVRLLAGAGPAAWPRVALPRLPGGSFLFTCPCLRSRGEGGQRHGQPATRRELGQVHELVRRVDGVLPRPQRDGRHPVP